MSMAGYVIQSILGGRRGKVLLGVSKCKVGFSDLNQKEFTYSKCQGRFLVPTSADDILFGNTFDRPLKLPWGTSAILKFMQYVPTPLH
jgi:hypothetical protein